jgi:hypothetical protein
MLLFTQRNAIDTRLTLVCNAIPLSDIVDFRSSDERRLFIEMIDETCLFVFLNRSRCIDISIE